MAKKTIIATVAALVWIHTGPVQAADKMADNNELIAQTQQILQQQLSADIRHNASMALAESFATSEVVSHQQPSEQVHARMAPQLPEAALLPITECNG